MSMIRAQEYFAPLRSRHISLQQWERGLLFESWGSRGGRADRQDSGDLNNYMAASDSEAQESRPVKKVIARSVSFSPNIGREVGSELKSKNFARGLSFPRSLASQGEIIPEEFDFCTARRSNTDHSHIFGPAQTSTAMFLFPRSLENSLESGHIESETSDSSFQDSEDSSDLSDPPAHLEPCPWPRKFFSGGLSFSRDRNFFSGVLSFSKDKKFFSGSLSLPRPCGKNLDRSQSLGVSDNFSPDLKNAAAAASSSESRLKSRFLARVLTFSRSLDPRGEVSKSNKGTPDNQVNKSFRFRRGLSFSRSLDPNGENKYFEGGFSFSRSLDDANCENRYFGRDLSFSRSLDPNGELLSSEDCSISGSPKLSDRIPQLSWSKKFISRSGLFFSKTFSPKRSTESPSGVSSTETYSEKDATEVRPKRLFGRGFSLSFSRFLDPNGDSSSVSSGGTNGPGKVDKESPFKRLFTRGFPFSNSKSVDPVDQPSSATASDTTGSSGNGAKSLSKRFFSKDWSWSRSKSRSTSPAKNSSRTIANSTTSSATDDIQACDSSDSNPAPSSRHSQALKNWWSKRCQSTGMSSRSGLANDQNSRLVLLEKVPAADDQESDDLTVYVGERGGSLTKYVLAKQILRHHLFQVLLKCSQDELGTDHDYTSGVPIICDPALFLQVARVVGGNFASETQLCR